MASVAVGQVCGRLAGCRCAPSRSTVRLLELPSGAFRRRGVIDDHSDAIEFRNPRRALPAHLTPGLCRRSPPAGDRWHRRQPVPAARFTPVRPRGSSAATGRARRNRQGDEDTAEGSVFGGAGDLGVVAGNRGVRSGRWRCRSGARSPTACDPSASLLRPAPSRPERAWPLGSRHAHRPALPDQHPSCTLYLSPSEVPKGRAERACP